MKPTLLAPSLQPGDAIGFFSPSAPATAFAPQRFQRAQRFIESKSYRLVAGSLAGRSDHYRSGSIRERAEEVNTLFRDPEIRCLMSTIGGANSNALLPFLDYDALRRDPKIVIGYSDVTALLLGIYAQTGLVTFYGPALVASFGEFPPLVDETFAPSKPCYARREPLNTATRRRPAGPINGSTGKLRRSPRRPARTLGASTAAASGEGA